MSEILRVDNLRFTYRSTSGASTTLDGLNLTVRRGEFVGIVGKSGSGKSTLFYLLGCLLKPDAGGIYLKGRDLTKLGKDELAYVRSEHVGFVFQQFHLLPRADVLENILLPSRYPCELPETQNRTLRRERFARAKELAEIVGLGKKLHHAPNQLSGGEQQRVAIARALLSDADLILADEPTGNLDSANAQNIMDLLRRLNRAGKTIVLITHDEEIARQCSVVYTLRDGKFETECPSPSEVVDDLLTIKRPRATSKFATYFRLARSVAPLAVQNLRRNKVRAMLTMLGVTVGIASVFSMITFGQFAKRRILEGYQEMGVNTLVINGWANDRRKATDRVDVVFRSFDWNKDVRPLRRLFPEINLISPMLMSWGNILNFGGQSTNNEAVVFGVTQDYLQIGNRKIREGRNLTPYHIENRSPVCLIGSEAASHLFREGGSPLDKILFVTRSDGALYPCRVIGVMEPHVTNKDWRKPNLDVFMPHTYFSTVATYWEAELHRFAIDLYPGSDTETVSRGIKNYLKTKYGPTGNFGVDSDAMLMAQMKKFLTLFSIMLTAIALVTLGVGGMGINNMMLVSLSERLKEIGLRKAVGATDRTIRVQFLFEACFLSGVAGLAGVLIGFTAYEIIIYGAAQVVGKLSFEWLIEPSALAFSLVSVLIVGIASGIVPALKAERLHVIEALRSE